MDFIPLAKAPCLLLVTGYHHLTYTSPNPPASAKSRQFVPSMADRVLKGMITIHTLDYVKACLWCSALAESAVIFANAYPSLPISNIIHEKLLFGGDRTQIRFTRAAAVGIALGIAAGTLRAWCYKELGKHFTFEMSMMKDHALVTTGPYSIVRHPSYAGTIMTGISVFLLHATKGSWVRESGLLRYTSGKIGATLLASILGIAASALLWRMKAEDRELRRRFGEKCNISLEQARVIAYIGPNFVEKALPYNVPASSETARREAFQHTIVPISEARRVLGKDSAPYARKVMWGLKPKRMQLWHGSTIVTHFDAALLAPDRLIRIERSTISYLRHGSMVRRLSYARSVIAHYIMAQARMKDTGRELRRRFGDKWDAWAAKLRYMITPSVL